VALARLRGRTGHPTSLSGYAVIFALLNELIGWIATSHAVLDGIAAETALSGGQIEAGVTLALKNILLIPVSVIVLLRIFRLIP
jgi:hypothetical protein